MVPMHGSDQVRLMPGTFTDDTNNVFERSFRTFARRMQLHRKRVGYFLLFRIISFLTL